MFDNELPPDRPIGFVVAVCGSIVQGVVFGLMNSFSVVSHLMTDDPSLGNPSAESVSAGAAISMGTAALVGVVAGPAVDRFGTRVLALSSVASMAGALVMCALFAHNAATIVATFSTCASLASGLMVGPTATAATSWMERRRAVVSGIVFAGGGVGSSTVPLLMAAIASSKGWRAAFLYTSTIAIVGLVAAMFVVMRRSPPAATNAVDGKKPWRALLTKKLGVLAVSFALFSFTYFSALYCAVPYAMAMGTGAFENAAPIPATDAATVMSWVGTSSIAGSLVGGWVAMRTGREEMLYVGCMAIVAIACGGWSLCRSLGTLSVGAGVVSFFQVAGYALVPPIVVGRFRGPMLGRAMGLCFGATAFGGYAGPTVTTAISHAEKSNYAVGIGLLGIVGGLSAAMAGLDIYVNRHREAHDPPTVEGASPPMEEEGLLHAENSLQQ